MNNQELTRLLPYLTPSEQAEVDRLLGKRPVWSPLPGPQTLAYESLAHELLFGGSAGGGKTDMLLGVAGTKHYRSIIFRRVFPSLRGVIDRSREIYNAEGDSHSKDSYNESTHIWRLHDGRMIELASMQYEKDKHNFQGRAHDLKGWDELTEFNESQYRFANAWCRTTRVGQRTRVIATSNPPTNSDGEWVIRYYAPWLDDQHPHPAQAGELRWFASIEGKEIPQEDGRQFTFKGESYHPKSRTFIPARLTDNPYLMATDYGTVLQNLPEPLRSQLLNGSWKAGVKDDPWQCIPTAWVQAAQRRWLNAEKPDLKMSSIGVDVARGGQDKTVFAPRFGKWFAPLERHPGADTPNGPIVCSLLVNAMRGTPDVSLNIDVIGVGASVYDQMRRDNHKAYGVNFANSPDPGATDRSRKLTFRNLRAQAYWTLREALDPDYGDGLMLPDDRELLADLCAPKWELRSGGILIEDKESIKGRLNRSPDCGDAVALAHLATRKAVLAAFS